MFSKVFVTESGMILPGTPLRPCCTADPAMIYLSHTAENVVTCATCSLDLFMNVPRQVRTQYMPNRGFSLMRKSSKRDVWSGNADTDKHWSK